jgi:hypothetical protein
LLHVEAVRGRIPASLRVSFFVEKISPAEFIRCGTIAEGLVKPCHLSTCLGAWGIPETGKIPQP